MPEIALFFTLREGEMGICCSTGLKFQLPEMNKSESSAVPHHAYSHRDCIVHFFVKRVNLMSNVVTTIKKKKKTLDRICGKALTIHVLKSSFVFSSLHAVVQCSFALQGSSESVSSAMTFISKLHVNHGGKS